MVFQLVYTVCLLLTVYVHGPPLSFVFFYLGPTRPTEVDIWGLDKSTRNLEVHLPCALLAFWSCS